MTEPQPPTIHEGASEESPAVITGSAEERKTHAALSTLETQGDDDDATTKKNVDTEALDKAMMNLDVKGGATIVSNVVDLKKVKVDPAHVTLLMNELLLGKLKATELLKRHNGDAVKALTAYALLPL